MTATAAPRMPSSGALMRTMAMFIKEFVQLRRDRLTFATMIFIPVVQLLLFGYAINTNPRNLPTAVLVHEESDVARSNDNPARGPCSFQASIVGSYPPHAGDAWTARLSCHS